MTGQDAVNVAEQFAEAAQFDGVILTKLDGDARGGAALSVKAVTGKPILFAPRARSSTTSSASTPTAWRQRILGMGDVLSFIEKAEKAGRRGRRPRSCERKLRKNEFTLEDFLDQLQEDPQDGPADLAAGDDARARRPPAARR